MDEKKDTLDSHRQFVSTYLSNHPYLSWLGVTLEEIERGRITMKLPFDERFLNDDDIGGNGVIHGGILASMVDHASGMAVRSLVDEPADASQVTVNMDVSYVRPATDDIYATGEVSRAGGGMAFTGVTVESDAPDGRRKVVATGQVVVRRFSDGD